MECWIIFSIPESHLPNTDPWIMVDPSDSPCHGDHAAGSCASLKGQEFCGLGRRRAEGGPCQRAGQGGDDPNYSVMGAMIIQCTVPIESMAVEKDPKKLDVPTICKAYVSKAYVRESPHGLRYYVFKLFYFGPCFFDS